jgi:divalent metal cation (Fe/Co/Zn/Cd) transporter
VVRPPQHAGAPLTEPPQHAGAPLTEPPEHSGDPLTEAPEHAGESPGPPPEGAGRSPTEPDRPLLLATALRLSFASVVAGVIIGSLSVGVGLADHSLGVLGTGLGVLADVAGSVALIWRFRAERSQPHHAGHFEARAAVLVAAALGLIGVVLVVESVRALVAGTHPGSSSLSLVAAGLALVVLPPLAFLKRRTAAALGSHALRGDSTLSAIGAATALLALIGLLLFRAFGWWWADRVVALLVAGVAAAECRSVSRSHGD